MKIAVLISKTHAHWKAWLLLTAFVLASGSLSPGRTEKPVLHGRHWVAITGKPLAATAGAMIFQKGGNAVDAACAMLGATCTMWDVLGWGGETQALIYNPQTKKVIGINALGVAPTGVSSRIRAVGSCDSRNTGRPDGHAG